MTPLVDIAGLHFHYPNTSFQLHIDQLELLQNQNCACIGPSGSGKSTLLRLMAGILTPDQGSIQVLDTDVSTLGDNQRRAFRLKHIGMVFQDFALIEYLSVLDNILLPCRIASVLPLDTAARDRAQELAERVGLSALLQRYPAQLSQGERQRLAICRALLPQPKLILADEPTGNLDPENKQGVVQLLKEQAAEHNATLIMVTHDHELLDGFERVVDFTQFYAGGAAHA